MLSGQETRVFAPRRVMRLSGRSRCVRVSFSRPHTRWSHVAWTSSLYIDGHLRTLLMAFGRAAEASQMRSRSSAPIGRCPRAHRCRLECSSPSRGQKKSAPRNCHGQSRSGMALVQALRAIEKVSALDPIPSTRAMSGIAAACELVIAADKDDSARVTGTNARHAYTSSAPSRRATISS